MKHLAGKWIVLKVYELYNSLAFFKTEKEFLVGRQQLFFEFMSIAKIIFLACLLIPAGQIAGSQPLPHKISGKVIAVKDGDTIEILFNGKPLSVRFAHIDCPEFKRSQAFGKAAKQFTSAMCFGQMVTVENDNKFDRYKRLIGIVINQEGKNVNKELMKAGLAWHFKKYSSDQAYAALEDHARARRVGLWKDENPIPPWDWRHK